MAKITVKGRLLNNAAFEPKTDETYDKTQYSALVVLEDGESDKIRKLVKEVCKEKFGAKIPAKLADWTVREGDDEDFENTFEREFINAKSNRQPAIVIRENGQIRKLDQEEDMIYAGVHVYVSIDVYAYVGDKAKKNPPGVSTGLRAIMFWKHGERLGDSVNADSEFEDFESEIDDDEEIDV